MLQFTRLCEAFVDEPLNNGLIESIDTFAFSPARRGMVSHVAGTQGFAAAFLAGTFHSNPHPGMQLVSCGCLPPLLALLTDPQLPDHTQERVASLTLEAVGVRSGVVSLSVHILTASMQRCMRSPQLSAADVTCHMYSAAWSACL